MSTTLHRWASTDAPTPAAAGPADLLQTSASASARRQAIPAVATADPVGHSRGAYFQALDREPALRAKAGSDSIGALLDLLGRADVPASVDRHYTRQAGSVGGGRVLMALDYTRGQITTETLGEAARQGPGHLIATRMIAPRLSHFRPIEGKFVFPGDEHMPTAFRDSGLWGPDTNQVGHLLCAVEAGTRMGRLSHHPIGSRVYDAGLAVVNRAMGLHQVEGRAADVTRAGIIGHEMLADEDGFTAQMQVYDRLVANGDPDQVRAHWDQAVAAVMANDHDTAWQHIRALGTAIEAPETPTDVARNLANEHPRFAQPHRSREGNSVQDIALSVYGYAIGYQAVTNGFATPEAARNSFEALFRDSGSEATAINQAADRR